MIDASLCNEVLFHPQQVTDDSGVTWARFFLLFRCSVDEFSSLSALNLVILMTNRKV